MATIIALEVIGGRGLLDAPRRDGARSSSSKKPGKLTATASASSIRTPSREASPATAPSIAIRWSPRLVDPAAAEPGRDAA